MIRAWLAVTVLGPMQAASALVGVYDGGAPEIAAGIELSADGRFRYALSYGALDEQAAGGWVETSGGAQLTSDPVTPPTITLTDRKPGPPGRVAAVLEVPAGVDRQYFSVRVATADRARDTQMGARESVIALDTDRPARVSVVLAMFDLESAAVVVDPRAGARLTFRFAPNDIGKVAFDRTPLVRAGGALLLERHGLTIRFRRAQ